VNRVFHIRFLVTALFATVTGGAASSCVKLTGVHDGCVVTADCNPGRQCVAGVCQVVTNRDASDTDRVDSAVFDVPSISDGSDAPETMPDARGNDASDVLPDADPPGDVRVDVPDAGLPGDVHVEVPDGSPDVPQDAIDSRPDGPVDAGDAGDGKSVVPPDGPPLPCDLPADAVPALASSSLPMDVAGTWQVCGDVSGVSADIVWLLGGTRTIHLDGFYWGRVAAGQASQGSQDGMYFQVLEGTRSILQFVDISVAAGGGATLAASYFPAAGVLDFTSCDGAILCGPSVVRLVRVVGDAGQ
jgi:hypothetical protein